MDRLKQLQQRIDELNIKERGLIMLAAILCCYMLWDSYLIMPQAEETRQMQGRITNLNKQILALRQQSAAIVTRSSEDPDAENKKKLEQLKDQHSIADKALNEATEHLIPSELMSRVLEDVLLKSSNLRFVSMKGLGVTPLIQPGEAGDSRATTTQSDKEEKTVIGAFKHGLQISFEGEYMDVLAYLQALEALDWSFFWHSVDYKVGEYPRATVTVTVYTLSLQDGWIDV